MHALIDQPRDVRERDTLDAAAVTAWLSGRVPGVSGTPRVRQFRGGASNLTYLLEWGDLELILRRPPAGAKASSAHDMGREVRMLRALRPHYSGLPEVAAWCEDPTVAGGEFYVMERMRGIILRSDLPAELGFDARQTRRLCESVLDKLIELHNLDVEGCGLGHLGRGEGYVSRQVTGWSRRYRAAKTDGAASFERVMAWLDANQRPDVGTRVIHGDFRFDNVVLDPADPMRVTGVLDWEMSTLGDPLMDVGNSLAYWVEAEDDLVLQMMRRQPTNAPGMLTRAEVWDRIGRGTGLDVSEPDFYEVYGLFRLAVILQQIWFREVAATTKNPAFAAFGDLAIYIETRCHAVLDRRGD